VVLCQTLIIRGFIKRGSALETSNIGIKQAVIYFHLGLWVCGTLFHFILIGITAESLEGAVITTAVPALDHLVTPLPSGLAVEFFGDWSIVNVLMHRVAVVNAVSDKVAVVLTQDFGGLDPYLMTRLVRVFRARCGEVLVARGFKVEDTLALFDRVLAQGFQKVLVVDPYLHLPNDPRKYWLGTAVTAGIRKLIHGGVEVAVFNRVSKFGTRAPEGGTFHHHSIHVLVRLSKGRLGVRAELIKHPMKPYTVTYFRPEDLLNPPTVRRTLLEWLGGH